MEDGGDAHRRVLVDKPLPRVVRITLNNPTDRNRMSLAMLESFLAILKNVRDNDSDCRVLLVRGRGRELCSGYAADVVFSKRNLLREALWNQPQFVVCLVHGHTAGAGVDMAIGADLSFMTGDSQLEFAEMQGLDVLPWILPSKACNEVMFAGGHLSGFEAERLGLVRRGRLVNTYDLESCAIQVVSRLSQFAKEDLWSAKQSMYSDLLDYMSVSVASAAWTMPVSDCESSDALLSEGSELSVDIRDGIARIHVLHPAQFSVVTEGDLCSLLLDLEGNARVNGMTIVAEGSPDVILYHDLFESGTSVLEATMRNCGKLIVGVASGNLSALMTNVIKSCDLVLVSSDCVIQRDCCESVNGLCDSLSLAEKRASEIIASVRQVPITAMKSYKKAQWMQEDMRLWSLPIPRASVVRDDCSKLFLSGYLKLTGIESPPWILSDPRSSRL